MPQCPADPNPTSDPRAMADDATPLASLSLTHVYYVPSPFSFFSRAKPSNSSQDPFDRVSLVCAYLALLPQALCVVYATLIWSTREAEVALMFAGQLACEAVNFLLKRIIKEERPQRIHGKGYGMPSSHAQFVFFWSVAVALFLLVRHRPPRVIRNNHRPWSFAERFLVSLGVQVIAAVVAWSRIYLGYHTPKQVLVGCLAGAVSAVAWFCITAVARQVGLLSWALEDPLVRWFRVRDLVVEEDLCQAGWEKWEYRRMASRQKNSEKSD